MLRLPQVCSQGVRAEMVRREGEHRLRDLPPELRAWIHRCSQENSSCSCRSHHQREPGGPKAGLRGTGGCRVDPARRGSGRPGLRRVRERRRQKCCLVPVGDGDVHCCVAAEKSHCPGDRRRRKSVRLQLTDNILAEGEWDLAAVLRPHAAHLRGAAWPDAVPAADAPGAKEEHIKNAQGA